MQDRLSTAAPMFAFDDQLTVVAWNEGAEKLTGISAAQAVGDKCWRVLAGRDDAGGVICHAHCSRGRLAREGWPLRTQEMHVRCSDGGRRRIAVETISVSGAQESLSVHLLRDAPRPDPAAAPETDAPNPAPHLTPRQLDVLRLLDDGVRARAIAARLGLSEATIRNHIRAVLVELGVHSQLQAVSLARRHGLI